MDSVNSFVDFFYNLVPGAIFLLIIRLILPISLQVETTSFIVLLLLFGLFIGFIFQGVNRLFKKVILNRNKIFLEVKCKDIDTFKKAKKLLSDRNLISSTDEEECSEKLEDCFHKMDNYLRGKPQSALIDHFATKAAFWSNTFWGSISIMLITISISLLDSFPQNLSELSVLIIFISSVVVTCFAYSMSREYWFSQYSVVLKTFIMVASLDKNIKIRS